MAQSVYEHTMETPITVTQHELLSLAPEVRSKVADATIKRRVLREVVAQTLVEGAPENDSKQQVYREPIPHATIKEIPDEDDPASVARDTTWLSHMPAAFSAAVQTPPPNVTIIMDPYEAYLQETGQIATPSPTLWSQRSQERSVQSCQPLTGKTRSK